MAKGDHARQQNQLNTQGSIAQNTLNNVTPGVLGRTQGLENRYNVAADQSQGDYGNLMNTGQGLQGNVQSLLGTILNGPVQNMGAYGGYQDFANNGGFSQQNIEDMRARDAAPMRAVYANAQADLNRQKALTGGYSPNFGAASAKMARELGYGLADTSTNTEAQLAQMQQQGRLAGLSGMTGIDTSLLNNQTQRLGLANNTLGQGTSLLGQMGNIYGTAPGAANMYGNQMLNSSGQGLQTSGLQNNVMQNYLQGQNNVANTQGDTAAVLGNVKSGLDLAGNAAKIGSQF